MEYIRSVESELSSEDERIVARRELVLPYEVLQDLQEHYFPGHQDANYAAARPEDWPFYRIMAADEFEASIIDAIRPHHVILELGRPGSHRLPVAS